MLSNTHTLVHSYFHILILPYSYTLILSYPHPLLLSYIHTLILSYPRTLVLSYPLTLLFSRAKPPTSARSARVRPPHSVVNINELWPPSASHYLGSLDLSLACSWTLSLALLLFYYLPLPLCNFVPLRQWPHGIRFFWNRVFMFLCSLSPIRSWYPVGMASCSYAFMLSHPRCHYALPLSCSHGLMPACSQKPPVTYVQRDAPSLSRFPFLDSTGFRGGSNPS